MRLRGVVLLLTVSLCALAYLVCETEAVSTMLPQGTGHPNGTNATKPQLVNDGVPFDFTIANIISITLCAIGIIANGFLLFVIFKDPLKNLRRSSWIAISNLAMADFVVSVTSIPMCNNATATFKGNVTAHRWTLTILYVGYYASFILLLCFVVERYIAVSYPMSSSKLLTRHRSRMACLASWIISVTMACMSWLYRGEDAHNIRLGFIALLEIIVILMIIVKILLIRLICMKQPLMVISDQRREQKRNMVITLLILIFVLIITALPYFVALQVQTLAYNNPGMFSGLISNYFPSFYFPIARLNFVINPFVYAWRLPDYRRGFLASFRIKKNEDPSQSMMKRKVTLSTVQETRI